MLPLHLTRDWRGLAAAALLAVLAACSRSPEQKEARFLAAGKAMLAKHELPRAILELRNAAQAMPKDAEPFYQLALVYLEMRDSTHAIASLRRAVALNPNHNAAQLRLAAFQLGSADDEVVLDARERIQKVLAAKPGDPEATEMLSISEMRLGQSAEGIAGFEKVLQQSPGDLKAALNLAKLKLMQKDVAGAEEILKRAAQANPKSGMAALGLANLYMVVGKAAESDNEVRRAAEIEPSNGAVLLALAATQMRANQVPEADKTYARVSALPAPEFKPLHAIFLFEQGRRGDAVAELAQLQEKEPNNRALRSLLVSGYLATDHPQKALQLLDDAIKRHPKDADALLQRSYFYLAGGKWKEMEQDVNTVIHFQPDSGAAHHALARLAVARGQLTKQRQELEAAIKYTPRLLAARTDLARALLRTNSPQGALEVLDAAPADQKSAPEYLAARNWALIASGEPEKLRQSIDAGLAAGGGIELMYQDAMLRANQKDFAGARKSLEKILEKNPESAASLDLLAQTYASEVSIEKAIEVVQEHAAKNPQSPYLMYEVGVWQAKANRRARARQAFADAVNAGARFPLPALVLAEMDLTDQNLNGARATLTGVMARFPGNTHARFLMGLVEERSGNRAAAVENYRAVVEADPANIDALNNLAYNISLDNPQEALPLASKAVDAQPENAAAQDTLGWIYFKQGAYQSALTHLKAAVQKEPNAVRQYHLGLTYKKVGEETEAARNLRAALQADPKVIEKVQ